MASVKKHQSKSISKHDNNPEATKPNGKNTFTSGGRIAGQGGQENVSFRTIVVTAIVTNRCFWCQDGDNAERVGFEPTLPCGKHALQACALGQTTLPLRVALFLVIQTLRVFEDP